MARWRSSFLTGNKVAVEQEPKSCVLESRGEEENDFARRKRDRYCRIAR
jgi:hypothetical protein